VEIVKNVSSYRKLLIKTSAITVTWTQTVRHRKINARQNAASDHNHKINESRAVARKPRDAACFLPTPNYSTIVLCFRFQTFELSIGLKPVAKWNKVEHPVYSFTA